MLRACTGTAVARTGRSRARGPMSMALSSCSRRPARMSAAACAGESTRAGAAQPLRGAKKAGKSSAPYASTATPCARGFKTHPSQHAMQRP